MGAKACSMFPCGEPGVSSSKFSSSSSEAKSMCSSLLGSWNMVGTFTTREIKYLVTRAKPKYQNKLFFIVEQIATGGVVQKKKLSLRTRQGPSRRFLLIPMLRGHHEQLARTTVNKVLQQSALQLHPKKI